MIGIVAFTYQGIAYTNREEIVDIGPFQMTAKKTKTLHLQPIMRAVAVAGGIVFWL